VLVCERKISMCCCNAEESLPVTCRAFWGRGGNAATHSTEAADLVVAAPQAQQQAYAVAAPVPPQRAYNVRGAPQATFLGAGWAALLLVRHLIPPPCWLALYSAIHNPLCLSRDRIHIECRCAPRS
jgi:hypothetical protein